MKKLLSALLVFTLIFTFAACTNDDTESKESAQSEESVTAESSAEESVAENSDEESSVDEDESAEESTEESSEEKGIVNGVYYGEGFSFTVPEGFTLTSDAEAAVVFTKGESLINLTLNENLSKKETMTKQELEEIFAQFGVESLGNFASIEVDGKSAVIYSFELEVFGQSAVTNGIYIFTDDYLYSLTLGSTDDVTEEFNEIVDSFTFE